MFTLKARNLALRAGVALGFVLVAGCATQRLHQEGMELLAQGRYSEALVRLQEAADQSPGDTELHKDVVRARELAGNGLVAAGNSERLGGRFDRAEAAYKEALRIDPKNGRAASGLEAVNQDKRHAALVDEATKLLAKNDVEGATKVLTPVFLENPNNAGAMALQRQIEERKAKEAAAAPSLKANFKKPVTLQFRDAGLRMVFESLARTSGINILLDKDVRADQKVSIFVKDTSVENTIDLIMLQNQLEKKVLSDNTIFIYPNQPAKAKDYQDLQLRSFHLVYADAKQMQTLLKTILKTKDLFINEKTNSIVMRDTPAAVQLAEKMIADQDIADPEVMLEVEVLQVTHTLMRQLGINYPDQLTLTAQPLSASNGSSGSGSSFTWHDLKNQTINNMLVSPIPSVTFNAHLDNSDADVLASPRIRARNHEKAKIHIGDRVPVMTNSVTPVASGTPVVTGSVQYLDVGLKLEVEPEIHSDGEVGIKVSLEVSSITNQVTNSVSGSVAYQIGTRTASTVLRLKDGETDVLAGLIDNETTRSATAIPGLGELPVLGRLFSDHTTKGSKSEIVLSITPRILGRTSQPQSQNIEYWTGTESNIRSEPFLLKGIGAIDMSGQAPAAAPAGARPAPGGSVQQRNQTLGFVWQGPSQARVGDKITVTLNGQSPLESVRSLSAAVNFDPAVLRAVDAVQGSFMRGNNVTANFSRDIGSSSVSINLEDSGELGAKGPGSIAAITFEVVGEGATQVTLGQASPSNPAGDSIAVTPPPPLNINAMPGPQGAAPPAAPPGAAAAAGTAAPASAATKE